MEGELANKNPHRYKGRYGYYYDTEAGLYLLSSRWYMPEICRFLTRDEYRGEAANPISMHRYAYCGNDPVKEGSIGWAHGVQQF
jgi:RHS repeat-associated protein